MEKVDENLAISVNSEMLRNITILLIACAVQSQWFDFQEKGLPVALEVISQLKWIQSRLCSKECITLFIAICEKCFQQNLNSKHNG